MNRLRSQWWVRLCVALAVFGFGAGAAMASEADLNLPDLGAVHFSALGGISGTSLMLIGIGVCFLGLGFGLI